jgi:hypothetical protein
LEGYSFQDLSGGGAAVVGERAIGAVGDALQVEVGKEGGGHAVTQDEIHALLLEHARAGLHVVRLKGGDPCLFGRGGEEALALLEAGIPCEIVPGVTSGLAVPALAGIPVPCLSSSLDYIDSYRTARLPQNLVQAMRDCFGAHTYERVDQPGNFHTEWM